MIEGTSLEVGQRVQWPAQGLGTVDGLREVQGSQFLMLKMDSGSMIGTPLEGADEAVWLLPSKKEAKRLYDKLLEPAEPDTRTFKQWHAAFMKTMSEGSLEDYVEAARSILADGPPKTPGELKVREIIDINVFAPLGEVLGKEPEAMAKKVAALYQD